MGRLKRQSPNSYYVYVGLTLVEGRDDAIIAALQNVPHRSLAGRIRELMRSGTDETQTNKQTEVDVEIESADVTL